ncbi:MAG: hypothetical protein ACREEP_12415, partial [Dongiaceae bacterium]
MTEHTPEYEIAELVWSAGAEKDRKDLDRARLPLNDYGNGQRLVSRFPKRLLHVDGIGWHVWDGTHWSVEAGEQEAVKLAHQTAQKISHEARALAAFIDDIEKRPDEARARASYEQGLRKRVGFLRIWAIGSGDQGRIRAMLGAALPYLRVPARKMDTHKFLFNCRNCTLAFERGPQPKIRRRKHDPGDFLTRLAAVDYEPAALCPEWDRFIEDVQPNGDMAHYLQAMLGYTLTADTSEQKVHFLTGEGSNGKSTVIDTASKLMG